MGNPNLQLELQSLIQSFVSACLLLYQFYGQEIKGIALLLIAFLSYKFGKKTVTDPLEKEIKQIRGILETRSQYTVVLPQRIKSNSTKITTLILLIVVGGIAYFALEQFQPQIVERVNRRMMLLAGGLCFAATVLLWFYQLILKFKLSRGKFNDHHITEKLSSMVKMLGSKAELLLKYYLCKQNYSKFKSAPAGVCSKAKCKQYRFLLKEKSDGIGILIDNVLNFEWCSVCKKRPPFDEFLDYKVNLYAKKEELKEELEVNDRNTYLLEEVQKMARWAKDVGPCNCSMRYWNESKRQILQFKKREKEIDQRITLFQTRQNLKR